MQSDLASDSGLQVPRARAAGHGRELRTALSSTIATVLPILSATRRRQRPTAVYAHADPLRAQADPATGLWCTPSQVAKHGEMNCIGGSFHIDFVMQHVVMCGNFDVIFGPFLAVFSFFFFAPSALHHPAHAVWCALFGSHGPRVLTGGPLAIRSCVRFGAAGSPSTRRRARTRASYGTFQLHFHRFDRLELDLRGRTQP